jgi:hypothetical protein
MAIMAEIGPQARQQALAELDRIEEQLSLIANWLDDHGEDRAAQAAFEGWRHILAVISLVRRGPASRDRRRAAADGLNTGRP